jgi:glycerol kinase
MINLDELCIIPFPCPSATRSTALGSALLAGSAVRFAGWDISQPETFKDVNTKGNSTFSPTLPEEEREKGWTKWKKAVEKCRGWDAVAEEE